MKSKMNANINKIVRKFLKNLLVATLITYILFFVIFIFLQKSFIYFPDDQDFKDCQGFLDYEKKTISNTRFYFKQGTDNALIYYHGNAGSTCDRSLIKEFFEENNYSIIFVEYTGYSNDQTKPNKEQIFKDVENIHKFLTKNNLNNNVVYGQSLGSGPASYHASLGNVGKLILVSPFSSMRDLIKSKIKIYPVSIILTEDYNNQDLLSNYNNRLLILHGGEDKQIPVHHSRKLYEGLKNTNKEHIIIENFGHDDIWLSSIFKKSILDELNIKL